jgi:SAM-dependent methyltransferase
MAMQATMCAIILRMNATDRRILSLRRAPTLREHLRYPRRRDFHTMAPVDPEQIQNTPAFNQRWYYRLELAPGLYTPGRDHRAVAQTRELLRHVDVATGGADGGGARCLDLGIQEAMVMILLGRRGAAEVVGYDRVLRKARLRLVEQALGLDLDLIGGVGLGGLPRALDAAGHTPFDVVAFSGVLYHMFDPLGGLTTVRGMVREGGICLVETTVAHEYSYAMHFNSAGRFTPAGLWFITPRLLDYLLRFLRLRPLDVVHVPGGGGDHLRPPQGRVAIACRAVSAPVAQTGDEWMTGDMTLDFAEFIDWDSVASDAPEVAYDDSRAGLVRRDDGTLDVLASIEATEAIPAGPEQTGLALGDEY